MVDKIAKRIKMTDEDINEIASIYTEEASYIPIFTARKDFVIQWNTFYAKLKQNGTYSNIPKMFESNLKKEGVI